MGKSVYQKWVAREISKCKLADMAAHLKNTRVFSAYKKGDRIQGSNRMGSFDYILSASPAKTASELKATFRLQSGEERTFEPHLHPREMLELGIFSGKMINDCMDEFPREWFQTAIQTEKLSPDEPREECNFYKITSRQTLEVWRDRKPSWIKGDDNRGWFQWYCRYALGRRDPVTDQIQMTRWRAIARWRGVIEKHPSRTKVRQALLQWSWPHA